MLELTKMSKPLMEKKRRARINNSLEQLKTLLEKHYSYNLKKRKLEKADILELTVKHIHNLLSMRQEGMAPVYQEGIIEYKEGFKDCLVHLSAYIMKTKTSQEKLNHMFVDQLNALAPQSHDGHLQNVLVSPSPTFLSELKVIHSSHHFKKINTGNLESGNVPRKPPTGTTTLSEESVITQEARRDQQVFFTQQIHRTGSPSSSCLGNLQPPRSCQQPTNACWRPW